MTVNSIWKLFLSIVFIFLITGCTNKDDPNSQLQENYNGRYYLYNNGVVSFDKWYELEDDLWRNNEDGKGTISIKNNRLILATSSDSITATVRHDFLKIDNLDYMHENNPFFPAVTFQTNEGSPVLKQKFNIDVEPETTKEGYEFDGWYLDSGFVGNRVTFPYQVTKDVKFYAKWKLQQYQVLFYNEDTVVKTLNYTYGSVINGPISAYKSNYSFAGWYKDSACTEIWNFYYDIVISDMALYAKWTHFKYSENVDNVVITGLNPYHNLSILDFPEEINGKKVKSISGYAFNNNHYVTEIIMPDSIESIENGSFGNCINLEQIRFSENLTLIGAIAFENCSKLKSFTIPDSVKTIGFNTFANCTSLINISLPESLDTLQQNLFNGCINLQDLVIPNNVKNIQNGILAKCNLIKSISIPASVRYIEDGAFSLCSSLTTINVDENNLNYKSYEGVLYNVDMRSLLYCPDGITGEYIMPDTTTYISRYAFDMCNLLEKIVLGKGIYSLPESIFNNLQGLTTVVLQEGLNNIGYNSFYGCINIKSIIVPSSVISINRYAFYNWQTDQIIKVVGRKSHPWEWPQECFGNATVIWDYVE